MANDINFKHRRSFGLYEEYARWRGNVHETQMQKRQLKDNAKDRELREKMARMAAQAQVDAVRVQSELRRVELELQERIAAVNAKSKERIEAAHDLAKVEVAKVQSEQRKAELESQERIAATKERIEASHDKANIEIAEKNYLAERDRGLGILQLQYDTEDRRKREAEDAERQGGFVRDFNGNRINGVYNGEYLRITPHGNGEFYYDDNRRYVGQFVAGRFEGQGDWYDENGVLSYSGEWVGGRFNGKGRLRIDDDHCFVGTFLAGHFCLGIFTDDFNAEIPEDNNDFAAFHLNDSFWLERGEYNYEGEMNNNKPNGRGIKKYTNGDYDDGMFVSGKAEGFLVRCHKGCTYIGNAKDNILDGVGQMTLSDGSMAEFDGKFRHEADVLVMNGKVIFPDGRVIEGEFRDQQLTGTGICKYPDGYVFEGTFSDNHPYDGLVKQTFAEGISVEIAIEHGRVKRNVTKYPDGAVFIGAWRNGEWKSGTLRLPDGSSYTGEFRNFQRHGFGRMIYTDGSEIEGEWRADIFLA